MDRQIKLLTPEDVATRLAIPPALVRNLIEQGTIPAMLIDGSYLTSELQLACFQQSHPNLLKAAV
ncbi:MAG: helix-turn-helix domain-containing protein [Actinobacteria bacterium]|nr:helix-turn-helix domain-containing protein [Actinomycetota bacterium]MBU1944137.1 helix-turn-helix domain-containing protein [Actinomycetota bacterium]MBU2687456.1 helix-turn-helix domain-containing protein [Actinomycetota bacterium]